MRLQRMGRRAVWVDGLPPGTPSLFAAAIGALKLEALLDVAPAPDSLALYFSGPPPDLGRLQADLEALELPDKAGRQVRLPVCFEVGEDLEEVSNLLALGKTQVIEAILGAEFEVLAIGFMPGFAYLGGLPSRLSNLPRRSSPRPRVEPGSIGIVGDRACIYPSASPGGWNLVGRTPVEMASMEDAYFPLQAGDRITFEAIDAVRFEQLKETRL
jgi:inhibitor of KinA